MARVLFAEWPPIAGATPRSDSVSENRVRFDDPIWDDGPTWHNPFVVASHGYGTLVQYRLGMSPSILSPFIAPGRAKSAVEEAP